jgi:hypothetical protein
MYPERQLAALSWHKARLRQRIALRRDECGGAVAKILRPFAWLDQTMAFARKLEPFALLATGLGGLLQRRAPAARPRLLGTLLRWGPVLVGAVRGFKRASRRTERD